MAMDLTSFLNSIAWVRKIDAEPDVYAERGAVYVDFYATLDQILKGDDNATTCLDVWAGDEEHWVCFDDAPTIDLDELNRWRWIVTAD